MQHPLYLQAALSSEVLHPSSRSPTLFHSSLCAVPAPTCAWGLVSTRRLAARIPRLRVRVHTPLAGEEASPKSSRSRHAVTAAEASPKSTRSRHAGTAQPKSAPASARGVEDLGSRPTGGGSPRGLGAGSSEVGSCDRDSECDRDRRVCSRQSMAGG